MSAPAPQPTRLPRGIYIAAVLALLLAGVIGMASMVELSQLARLSETKDATLSALSAQGESAFMTQLVLARFSAENAIREPRSFLLGLLAMVCGLAFVAAGRILRPGGLPREGMRQLLCWTSLLAAVLRTIDGAQFQVVIDHVSTALLKSSLPSPWSAELFRVMLTGLYQGMTAAVAGSFALLGQYFRSERVRQVLIAQDSTTE